MKMQELVLRAQYELRTELEEYITEYADCFDGNEDSCIEELNKLQQELEDMNASILSLEKILGVNNTI